MMYAAAFIALIFAANAPTPDPDQKDPAYPKCQFKYEGDLTIDRHSMSHEAYNQFMAKCMKGD